MLQYFYVLETTFTADAQIDLYFENDAGRGFFLFGNVGRAVDPPSYLAQTLTPDILGSCAEERREAFAFTTELGRNDVFAVADGSEDESAACDPAIAIRAIAWGVTLASDECSSGECVVQFFVPAVEIDTSTLPLECAAGTSGSPGGGAMLIHSDVQLGCFRSSVDITIRCRKSCVCYQYQFLCPA